MPYVPDSPLPASTPPTPEALVLAHLDLARVAASTETHGRVVDAEK